MVLVSSNPKRLARRAKLRHVSDDMPGFSRTRHGRGFSYEYANGKPVTSEAQLERIRKLAIPPAWTDVWICKTAKGHLQATGRDDAKRKQYLYHEQWHEKVNEIKFDNLLDFGQRLPKLRPQIASALRQRKSSSQRMLALLVRILDETGIRIGNESYTRDNGSHGLTTLLGKHLSFANGSAELRFPGKSSQKQHFVIEDRQIVRLLKSFKPKPNQPLFGYDDDRNQFHQISAPDLNSFLHDLSGAEVTAKDFRTWVASARLAMELHSAPACETKAEIRRNMKDAVNAVADFLGHTPTICKRYYLHPGLLTAYEEGRFSVLIKSFHKRKCKWLRPEDQLLIHILKELQKY
jgi:DNA topoisomerase-1